MKRVLTFVIRLSVINFILFILAVGLAVKYSENYVYKAVQKQNIPVETNPTVNPSGKTATGSISSPTPTPNLFSELQNHNSRSDCWILYAGHIYDITLFFGSHPGGDAIMLPYCGKDATAAFNGVPHSGSARSLLEQYLIQ